MRPRFKVMRRLRVFGLKVGAFRGEIMQPEQIQALLQDKIEGSQVDVSVDGSHVNVVVVSPVFEGLSPVKKQQLVYAVLSEQIASGVIHAVNMKTYTPEQWAKVQ